MKQLLIRKMQLKCQKVFNVSILLKMHFLYTTTSQDVNIHEQMCEQQLCDVLVSYICSICSYNKKRLAWFGGFPFWAMAQMFCPDVA